MDHVTDTFNKWIGYVALLAVVISLIISGTASYDNTLAACERGNVLRGAVYGSVFNAEQNAAKGQDGYAKELKVLLSVPHTDPRTGQIDCKAAVAKPFYVIK